MKNIFILTIDGPAGVGKSSIAKGVASVLGVAYLDTGAMFRLLGLELAKKFSRSKDFAEIPKDELLLTLQEFDFALQGSGENTVLVCNGLPVTDEIRSESAGMLAANIGTVPEVRDFLKKAQKELGSKFDLLAEGRDMGTVVFPEAACKFFLDATPEVRAMRRYKQLEELKMPANFEVLLGQIKERDYQDRNRAIAPLMPAKDALIIDTSHRSLAEVSAIILAETSRVRP